MKTELEQIVEGCKKRQAEAQKQLYDRFAPSMLGVCMRYTHSRDEAQDLLHDGFIKVFEKIKGLENPQAVKSWIYRIMMNTAINYVARNRELVYVDFEEMEGHEEMEQLTAEEDETPPYTMEEIVNAIQQLPDRYRLPFNMREVEEMEYAEIARRLKQPESTVRSSVTRARQMLRKILWNLNKQ